jgi:hypothetical protein
MSKRYKNILKMRDRVFGPERRSNLYKQILKDSTPLPLPIEYKDIDEEFKRWVDEELYMEFEGTRVPTIALFSNQRFTEYMQSWQSTDNKKNLLLNFKTVTRENNPKAGTIVGQTRNIPGERTYLMRRVESRDRAGRKYYTDYRVKQPFSVDLIYTVSIVTNKYEMLNDFNQMINDKFKAIDCYIRPNGHFIPMKLNDISDKSEYSIDNRQFYSQSYNITVMAYIMPEDSFIVEERPDMRFIGFEGDYNGRAYAEVEDLPCNYTKESKYAFVPMKVTIHFEPCDDKYKFAIDCDFQAKEITLNNIRDFKIFVNDKETVLDKNFRVKTGDEIAIKSLIKIKYSSSADIEIEGVDPTETYKKEEGADKRVIEYS